MKDQLKERLFASISAQIDAIGYVPQDIAKMVGDVPLSSEALGRSPEGPAPVGEPADLARRINGFYDASFYARDGLTGMLVGESDYRNIGYWNESTVNQQQASERLQDTLLDFIPEKTGRILDVACGMGASTRRLLRHYPPQDVWAINISEKQVESTRQNAPGCHAQVMNAVELTFDDSFFDNILCIEAAFHFETRRKFLEQALRVLKPGGRLVLSDVLFTSAARLEQYPIFPSAQNHLVSVDEYRALLADVGFADAVVKDLRDEIWGAHFLHVVDRIHREFYRGKLSVVHLTEILWTYYHLNAITGPCLLVCAQKP